MCDTIYAPGFWGKNSDRVPSEPQSLCLVPRRPARDQVEVGGKVLKVQDKGFAMLLSKPSWMQGGEMGINEFGVAIGNEAVFSKFKPAKDGVLGMDILRLALGSSSTAKEAVEYICAFVEKHEQGGNGAYKGSLYYDNSFLIADPSGAYVVETAAHRWAWRPANQFDAISNIYTIEEDFKRLDPQSRKELAPVNERAACSDESDPGRKGHKDSYKYKVENTFYPRFTRGEQRRALSLSLLERFVQSQNGVRGTDPASGAKAQGGIAGFLAILRSHGDYDPRRSWPFQSPLKNMESLCVHAGGFPNNATTASLAVEYRGSDAIIWFTGTSYPCISLYKPMLLCNGSFIPLWKTYDYAEGSDAGIQYWSRQHAWIVSQKAGVKSLDPAFASRLAETQASLVQLADAALNAAKADPRSSALAVYQQEAEVLIAGWAKDSGL